MANPTNNMAKIDRDTNLNKTTHKPGEGAKFMESAAATTGAKDSTATGSNTTTTYSTSGPSIGKKGAMRSNQ